MIRLIRAISSKLYLNGFLIGAGKIVMAVFSHSWLLFIHAIYSIIKASAKYYAMKEHHQHAKTMLCAGLLVIAASAVYLIYSVYIYFYGSPASYHQYIAIGIAVVTVYELLAAGLGLKKAKKSNDHHQETIKYINLASALISVSLTQTAILSCTNEADVSKAYAVGDATFGFLALWVGMMMLFRANRLKKAE